MDSRIGLDWIELGNSRIRKERVEIDADADGKTEAKRKRKKSHPDRVIETSNTHQSYLTSDNEQK